MELAQLQQSAALNSNGSDSSSRIKELEEDITLQEHHYNSEVRLVV